MNASRIIGLTAAALLLISALPSRSRADDRSAGVPLPSPVSVPPGSVAATASQVTLNGDSVTIRLSLASRGNPGLSIRPPRFGWLGEAEPYPDRQFPELRATLDGSPLPDRGAAAAFVGGRDITADVKAAGLDPYAVSESPPFVTEPGGAARRAFARLVAEHAVTPSDGGFLAAWTVQRVIRFGLDGRPEALSITYRARPGFDLVSLDRLARSGVLASYCTSEADLREHLGIRSEREVVARRYEIPAGIDGRAPVRLLARVEDRDTVFCGQDGKAVYGPTGAVPVSPRGSPNGILSVLRLSPAG